MDVLVDQHSRRDRAERFRPLAEKAWRMQQGKRFVSIELRRFAREA